MDHSQPHPLADPIPDRALEIKFERFAASHASHRVAGPPNVRAELECYAVVLQAVDKWGGYQYINALNAIAAAKRGLK